MTEEYYLATFKSTHDALYFDKEVSLEGYKTVIMPVPRNIGSSCGLAVRFNIEDKEKIENLVEEKKLKVDSYYIVENLDEERIMRKLQIQKKE